MNREEFIAAWAEWHYPPPEKEVADLTNEERMALCIAADVPLKQTEAGLVTAVRIGIIKQTGGFRVIQESELPPLNHGHKITFNINTKPNAH